MQGVHTDTEKTKFFVCTILLKSIVCFTLLGNISKIPVKLQKKHHNEICGNAICLINNF